MNSRVLSLLKICDSRDMLLPMIETIAKHHVSREIDSKYTTYVLLWCVFATGYYCIIRR